MPQFVIYEIWTRATVATADNEADASNNHDPDIDNGDPLNLANWHAIEIHPNIEPEP